MSSRLGTCLVLDAVFCTLFTEIVFEASCSIFLYNLGPCTILRFLFLSLHIVPEVCSTRVVEIHSCETCPTPIYLPAWTHSELSQPRWEICQSANRCNMSKAWLAWERIDPLASTQLLSTLCSCHLF